MRLLLFALLFLLLNNPAFGLDLLSIDHPIIGKKFVLESNADECHFSNGNTQLKMVVEDEDKNRRDLELFEKIYFSINYNSSKERFVEVVFSGLSEASFFIYLYKDEKGKCLIEKEVFIGDELTKFHELKISYNFNLYFPTLREIHFYENEKIVSRLESFKLQSYFPFYEFSLGLAANIHSNIRKEDKRLFNKDKTVVEPVPAFLFRYGPVFLSKDGAGVLLVPLEKFVMLATFLLEGEPYKSDFTFERKRSVYFGPLIKSGPFELQYYRDIRGVSHGEVFKFTIAPDFNFKYNIKLSPRIFYQYWDEKYVDYYFGIPQRDATSEYPYFKGSEATNYGISLRGSKKFKHFDLGIEIGEKFYSKEVSNSPTVIKSNEFRLFIGLMYRLL